MSFDLRSIHLQFSCLRHKIKPVTKTWNSITRQTTAENLILLRATSETSTAIKNQNQEIVMSIKFSSSRRIVHNFPVNHVVVVLTIRWPRESGDAMSNMLWNTGWTLFWSFKLKKGQWQSKLLFKMIISMNLLELILCHFPQLIVEFFSCPC